MSSYLNHLVRQVVSAFLTTFAGVLVASGFGLAQVTDMAVYEKAGVAGLGAALMLIKGALAKFSGNKQSPNLLVGPGSVSDPAHVE